MIGKRIIDVLRDAVEQSEEGETPLDDAELWGRFSDACKDQSEQIDDFLTTSGIDREEWSSIVASMTLFYHAAMYTPKVVVDESVFSQFLGALAINCTIVGWQLYEDTMAKVFPDK